MRHSKKDGVSGNGSRIQYLQKMAEEMAEIALADGQHHLALLFKMAALEALQQREGGR